jgi:2-dehydropantoate 2-reductase
MMEDRPRICVFGAGAIGGFLGSQLAGTDVELSLVARGAHLVAMQEHGLRLQIDGEERVTRIRCSDDPAELGEQDYVIVAIKAHTIGSTVESMQPLLGRNTTVVTAFNGIPYWYFHGNVEALRGTTLASVDPGGVQRDRLGSARAIGCVVLPATSAVAPGIVRHEHGHRFPIGEPDGTRTPRVERLHDILVAAGLEAPIREDIRDEIWLKLCGNVCFNPISALTMATLDVIAGSPGTRALCRAMMSETKMVGERIGVKVRVDLDRRLDGAVAVGAHRMSMLQDLEAGRSLEIEPLVGAVQELGRLTDVPTPTIDIVLTLIRQRASVAGLDASRTPMPH